MTRNGVVLGLIGGGVAALALAPAAIDAVAALNAARQARADQVAKLAAPVRAQPPLVPASLAVRAGDGGAAARMLAGRVRTAAAGAGVLVETLQPGQGPAGLIVLRLNVSGPEKAVIALVDGIERGEPLTRFRSWQIRALPDGGVRAEGEVVAAWR